MAKSDWKQLDITKVVQPVAIALDAYLGEDVPFVKIHRLIDSYEATVKYCVCLLLVAARAAAAAPQRVELEKILAESIARPALGHWQGYLRILLFPAQADDASWLQCSPGNNLQIKKKRLNRLMELLGGLRNHFGHGAVASAEACDDFCAEHDKNLREFILLLRPLLYWPLYGHTAAGCCHWNGLQVQAVDLPEQPLPESPWISFGDGRLSLLPLLYMPDEYYFFNSMVGSGAKAKLKYLCYGSGEHHVDTSLAPRFLTEFPQPVVRSNDALLLRSNELEHLVGREEETAEVCRLLAQMESGHIILWGAPGVGKGALMARIMEALDGNNVPAGLDEETQSNLQKVAKGIRFDWFARQEDGDPLLFMRELVRTVARGLKKKIKLTSDLVALQELFRSLLQEAVDCGKTVTLVVDGLDETLGVHDDNLLFLRQLPSQMLPGCFLLLSSRPVAAVRHFWLGCTMEQRHELTVHGLSAELVRAMLFSQLNKYTFVERPEIAEAIYTGSVGAGEERGNPLYVTLTIKDFKAGKIDLSRPLDLPLGLEQLYAAFIRSLPAESLKLLYLVASAHRAVSRMQMARVLRMDRDAVDVVLEPVLEMLVEDVSTPQVEDYLLFHKSLQDYLYRTRGEQMRAMSACWLDFCRTWNDLRAETVRASELHWNDGADFVNATDYALRHFVDHWLAAVNVADAGQRNLLMQEAMALIDDKNFRRAVLEYCGQIDPLRRLVEQVQDWLEETDNNGDNLQTVFRYALYLTVEKGDFVQQLSGRVKECAAVGNVAEAVLLAGAADDPGDRVFLAMQAVRAVGDVHRDALLAQGQIKVSGWLREIEDEELSAAWEAVVAMAV